MYNNTPLAGAGYKYNILRESADFQQMSKKLKKLSCRLSATGIRDWQFADYYSCFILDVLEIGDCSLK